MTKTLMLVSICALLTASSQPCFCSIGPENVAVVCNVNPDFPILRERRENDVRNNQ